MKNRDRLFAQQNEYKKKRNWTDFNFRLLNETSRSFHPALKSELKSSSAMDKLVLYNGTYKKWINFEMSPEINWSNIEFDHVKTVCTLDVSKDEELRETFKWKYTHSLSKKVQQHRGN